MNRYNRDSFCKTMIINEALFGQNQEQLNMMIEEVDVDLNFDFEDFYIFITGLPKRTYTKFLGMTRKDFKLILETFIDDVERIKANYHIRLQHAVLNYDQSKQIVFLIKQDKLSVTDIYRLTDYLTQNLQHLYYTIRDLDEVHLANYSVLSDKIPNYGALSAAFFKTKEVSRLAYFNMKAQCVMVSAITVDHVGTDVIKTYINDLSDALMENDMHKLDIKLDSMFAIIKASLNYSILDKTMIELNRVLANIMDQFELHDLCDIPLDYHMDTCIEVSVDRVRTTLHTLANSLVGSNDSKLSSITQSVLLWIKDNYNKDVGLQSIADKLQLNPSYISRTFSRDMHCSFSSYLTKYRLERAKVLLVESDDKILNIAEKVGFNNGDYFSVVFKKEMGMSPQQYRHYYASK